MADASEPSAAAPVCSAGGKCEEDGSGGKAPELTPALKHHTGASMATEAPAAPLPCPHIATCVTGGATLSEDDPRLAFEHLDECECGKAFLNWVCLNCLAVFCGRKGSTYSHTCATVVCNYASASVRCTACQRTIDNAEIRKHPHLLAVMHRIHDKKYGHRLMLKPRSHSRVGATIAGIEEQLSASKTIEKRWEEFQAKFQAILDASVGMIGQSLGVHIDRGEDVPEEVRNSVFGGRPSLEAFAAGVREGRFKNIVVVAGAGLSTSAGLPDFRSPDTGLYAQIAASDTLEKYGLSKPEDLFDVSFFRKNPLPFYGRARALYPGQFRPTPAHYLLRLLDEKGVLRRVYTQNIDGLEDLAGVRAEKVVQCHGGFRSARCIDCRKEIDTGEMRSAIFSGEVLHCVHCGGLAKPDIVFFGETLSSGFAEHREMDVKACDAMIVIGTSLTVAPTAHLPKQIPLTAPRVLLNREPVGDFWFGGDYDDETKADFAIKRVNYRDVPVLGDCDAGAEKLAAALGWGDDFRRLVTEGRRRFDAKRKGAAGPRAAALAS